MDELREFKYSSRGTSGAPAACWNESRMDSGARPARQPTSSDEWSFSHACLKGLTRWRWILRSISKLRAKKKAWEAWRSVSKTFWAVEKHCLKAGLLVVSRTFSRIGREASGNCPHALRGTRRSALSPSVPLERVLCWWLQRRFDVYCSVPKKGGSRFAGSVRRAPKQPAAGVNCSGWRRPAEKRNLF